MDNPVLKAITDRYLNSRDFNGSAIQRADLDLVEPLVREGLVSVVFGDRHPNPHILALDPGSINEQLAKLKAADTAVAYPSRAHLEAVVDRSKYHGRPYELALALGHPQLAHRAFELAVLEGYRNDPRYSYESDDIHGTLYARDGASLSARDDTSLNFGFAFSEDTTHKKYAAAFLRYLADLTPEHQQIWAGKEVNAPTFLHPDYFRTSIVGDFPERLSIYEAFTWELEAINRMAAAMGKPPLFRSDYKENRPQHFASLLRPTGREFNQFIQLLDQMMSDNLNKDFFRGDIELTSERTRDDGKVEVQQKGTVQLLADWFAAKFRAPDAKPIEDLVSAFREVRRLRNKPSHSVQEDAFHDEIALEQRELMHRACGAVRTIRLAFANHPAVRGVEVDPLLFEGKIWPF